MELLLPHPEVLLDFLIICSHQHHVATLDLVYLFLDELLHLSTIAVIRPELFSILIALSSQLISVLSFLLRLLLLFLARVHVDELLEVV